MSTAINPLHEPVTASNPRPKSKPTFLVAHFKSNASNYLGFLSLALVTGAIAAALFGSYPGCAFAALMVAAAALLLITAVFIEKMNESKNIKIP